MVVQGWTEALAETADLAHRDIPADVLLVAQTCVLDWLAVAIAGCAERAPRAARTAASPGSHDLIGGGTASLVDAVRVNGTAGHVLDYDDVHIAMLGHPTAPVLPALLSAAPSAGASGADLLTALVAGIEAEGRVGSWLARPHQDRGFHTTATLGVLGAAVACANLVALSPAQTRAAIGLAATSASGLKSAFGTAAKSLQVGRAASEGLEAALLARAGADVRPDMIEASSGFASAYASTELVGQPDAELDWHTLDVIFKYHPSCYMTHSGIEGAIELRRLGVDPRRIEEIVVTVAPRTAELCDNARPRTPTEARFSVSHTVATALSRGAVPEAAFAAAALSDPTVRSLSERVRLVVEDLPEFASVVRVRTDSGDHEASVDVSLPVRRDRLVEQWERVVGKARDLLAGRVGGEPAERLIDSIERLNELGTLEPVWRICRQPLLG